MKTLRFNMLSLFLLLSGGLTVFAQQYQSEVPGDNFSLEGALELFKKSASPEEFERLLNNADSKVNNLDLNGDGMIDYIRVIDRNEGAIHAFILQAVISNTESQDVAVIELEKLANGKAVLQITGDEDIYGIETIIEPTEEVRINAGTTTARTVVNVWAWPSVQYVYSPYYTVWNSPWHWHLRPVWWSSWRPVVYVEYVSWWQPYRPYYTRCHSHRIVYAQEIYRPYRTASVVVHQRHHAQVKQYRSAHQHDRSSRERYEGRSTRSRQEGTSLNREERIQDRTPASRQRDGRSTFTPRDPQQRTSEVANRTPERRNDYSSTNRSNHQQRSSDVFQRRSAPERQQVDLKRSTSVRPERNTQPRESRSVITSERSRNSGGNSGSKRTGSGGRKDLINNM